MHQTSVESRLRQEGFVPLPPFFVLKEGTVQDSRRPESTVTFTKSRLEKLAEVQNSRIEETEDATPIIIGHSRRHLMEKEQPPLTGWATDFKVVPFYSTRTFGLQATPWALPSDKQNFAKFPRRSVELWTSPDMIDPISLLGGATTPMQDLGTPHLKLSKHLASFVPRTPLILEMCDMTDDTKNSNTPPDTTDKADPGNIDTATSGNSADMAQLKSQMAEVMQVIQLLKPFLEELKGGVSDGTTPGGESEGEMGMNAPPEHHTFGGPPPDMPQQQSSSPPGMGNAMLPQHMSRPGYTDPRDSIIATLQYEVAQLKLSRIHDDVTVALNGLSQKVVVPDRERDYKRLVQLSKVDRDAEIKYLETTRRPVETPGLRVGVLPEHQAIGDAQPMQFQKLVDGMTMPGDPSLKAQPTAAVSEHDKLMDIVRNRGKMSSMDAYRTVMGNNGQRSIS